MKNNLAELKVLGDHRGLLIALEANKEVPFDVKRVFYIYATQDGISRGNHAHYKTKQFLVAVHGSCKITLDNGRKKQTYELNKPSLGLFQDALVWGTMFDFSSDCVLVVLADAYYEASDYIAHYDNFLEVLKNDL